MGVRIGRIGRLEKSRVAQVLKLKCLICGLLKLGLATTMRISGVSIVAALCACALAPRVQGWPGVSGARLSDEQLRRLAWRSGLIVSARLESKPQRSNIVISDSYAIWMLRLRPSQVFKGQRPAPRPAPRVLDAEFDTDSGHLRGVRADAPPSRVGAAYLMFLADRSPNSPRWKVLGMKPYSRALALQLRRVQAARAPSAASR